MRVAFPSLAHKDVREEEVVTEVDPLSAAILQLLAEAPPPGAVSLPRIGKRLGLSASALLRHLTVMSDAQLAGQPGPGWVRVTQTEERWIVFLTEEGRATAAALIGSGPQAPPA